MLSVFISWGTFVVTVIFLCTMHLSFRTCSMHMHEGHILHVCVYSNHPTCFLLIFRLVAHLSKSLRDNLKWHVVKKIRRSGHFKVCCAGKHTTHLACWSACWSPDSVIYHTEITVTLQNASELPAQRYLSLVCSGSVNCRQTGSLLYLQM